MYVVSVLDNGEQRTFISDDLEIADRVVYATIRGAPKQFRLSEILDIVSVDAKLKIAPHDSLSGSLAQQVR